MKPIIKNRWVKSYLLDGGKDGSIPKEHLDAVRERAEARKANSRSVQELKEDMVNEDLDEHFAKEEDPSFFRKLVKVGSKDAS